MQAKEGGTSTIGSGGSRRRSSGTTAGASSKPRSAVIFFFFLVILIFTHLGFCLANPDETDQLSGRLSPRKARFLEATTTKTMKTTTTTTTTTTTASFRHAPISPAPQSTVDMINGEDKRIVHTGPNPLHN
ncbi:CLAVATA3/ESR (CLE)-related protein [Trema orientale]|uniref:CLAVATA3/ESR (CLE)-related protein n=1 Tax=Trema orientale TaxID=63057 RepID=A0A2P5FK30_TREOI|nr:CLAVATA3/ESR (CLE)-related protein [Trema orientale]